MTTNRKFPSNTGRGPFVIEGKVTGSVSFAETNGKKRASFAIEVGNKPMIKKAYSKIAKLENKSPTELPDFTTIEVVAFGHLAPRMEKLAKEGRVLVLSGDIKVNTYQEKTSVQLLVNSVAIGNWNEDAEIPDFMGIGDTYMDLYVKKDAVATIDEEKGTKRINLWGSLTNVDVSLQYAMPKDSVDLSLFTHDEYNGQYYTSINAAIFLRDGMEDLACVEKGSVVRMVGKFREYEKKDGSKGLTFDANYAKFARKVEPKVFADDYAPDEFSEDVPF